MPRNLFRDPFDGIQQGYETAQGITDDIRNRRAQTRAAPKIAQGDFGGAAKEYGAMGMADQANQMAGQQRKVDQSERDERRQMSQDDIAVSERNIQMLTRVAQGLKGVPAGQRKAALDRAAPIFQQMKIDPSQFAGLTEEQLTDDQLDLFAGELERQWQFLSLGGGGVGRTNTRTGEFETLREPTKPLILANGATAYGPDGEIIARNEKKFAPPRPSSANNLPPPPAGWR